MTEERKIAMKQCYSCKHRRKVSGNAHIACAKPDPDMKGDPHGIKNGWWSYPFLFDPTWNTTICKNHEDAE